VTLFDAQTVNEAATFAQPVAAAIGISTVLVNGKVVWEDGKPSGQRPGRVLRREGPPVQVTQ
jgi:N-acyl-D-amino-acid deacylase